MFCDLVASTDLVATLDPEDAGELLGTYQRCCAETIEAHGGFVAQYLGDGILAYFGYPVASEDAAEDAVRAGLETIAAVGRLKWRGGRLAARVGIATGTTLVTSAGAHPGGAALATGSALNLASRIQALVSAEMLGMSDTTYKLVRGKFDCADLGLHALRGFARPRRIWRAHRAKIVPQRLRISGGVGASRLIGRGAELGRLQALWRTTRTGSFNAVTIRGEAGIGKSHLARALRDEVRRDAEVLTLQCSALHRLTPAHPLSSFLDRATARRSDGASGRVTRVAGLLGAGADARLLASLLFAGDPDADRLDGLAAAERMARLRTLVMAQLARLTRSRPLLLIVEDVQWADPTTVALLDHACAVLADVPLMLVLTRRSDGTIEGGEAARTHDILLSGLTDEVNGRLVDRVEAGRLTGDVAAQIVARSDGNPFYAIEMTLATIEVCENDAHAELPVTLIDSVTGRLDRLGDVKRFGQYASVIGRRFQPEMLAWLTGETPDVVRAALARLSEARVVVPVGAHDGAYQFRHALFQEVAYATLLHSHKRALHAALAYGYEARALGTDAAEPETIAFHWSAANEPERALPHWLAAGNAALLQGANNEAIAHFRRGLDMLADAAVDAQDRTIGFELNLGLARACYVGRGPAHPETVAAFTRAHRSMDVSEDGEQHAILLYGMFSAYHFASRLDLAEQPAERMMRLAERSGSRVHRCLAHRMAGYIAFFRGEADTARAHFEVVRRNYDFLEHAPLANRFGADALSATSAFASVLDALDGNHDAAAARIAASLAQARATRHSASIGWSLAARCYVAFLRNDPAQTARVAAEGVKFCKDNEVSSWLIHCRLFELTARTDVDCDKIRHLIDVAGAGNRLGLPLFRGALADALAAAGDLDAALAEIAQGLRDVLHNGQHVFGPYLRRRQSEMRSRSGDVRHAETIMASTAAACSAERDRRDIGSGEAASLMTSSA